MTARWSVFTAHSLGEGRKRSCVLLGHFCGACTPKFGCLPATKLHFWTELGRDAHGGFCPLPVADCSSSPMLPTQGGLRIGPSSWTWWSQWSPSDFTLGFSLPDADRELGVGSSIRQREMPNGTQPSASLGVVLGWLRRLGLCTGSSQALGSCSSSGPCEGADKPYSVTLDPTAGQSPLHSETHMSATPRCIKLSVEASPSQPRFPPSENHLERCPSLLSGAQWGPQAPAHG